MCLSVSLSVCLFVSLSVCQSICVFVCVRACGGVLVNWKPFRNTQTALAAASLAAENFFKIYRVLRCLPARWLLHSGGDIHWLGFGHFCPMINNQKEDHEHSKMRGIRNQSRTHVSALCLYLNLHFTFFFNGSAPIAR